MCRPIAGYGQAITWAEFDASQTRPQHMNLEGCQVYLGVVRGCWVLRPVKGCLPKLGENHLSCTLQ
jgi:hypothetical protein